MISICNNIDRLKKKANKFFFIILEDLQTFFKKKTANDDIKTFQKRKGFFDKRLFCDVVEKRL